MQKITEYKFLTAAKDITSLAEKINLSLKEGWQPYGPPTYDNKSQYMIQAMVRHETV